MRRSPDSCGLWKRQNTAEEAKPEASTQEMRSDLRSFQTPREAPIRAKVRQPAFRGVDAAPHTRRSLLGGTPRNCVAQFCRGAEVQRMDYTAQDHKPRELRRTSVTLSWYVSTRRALRTLADLLRFCCPAVPPVHPPFLGHEHRVWNEMPSEGSVHVHTVHQLVAQPWIRTASGKLETMQKSEADKTRCISL
ncbi:Xylulose kinase [Manis javanica]|nr:Xylulose kinase [Manis javanica]